MCKKGPFDGVDLATLPYSIYDALLLAKEESEDAEIEIFEPEIEKEGGNLTWKGRALQVGLVKNRVLYATVRLLFWIHLFFLILSYGDYVSV